MSTHGNEGSNLIRLLEKAPAPNRGLDADIYRAVVDEFAPSFSLYLGMVWSGSRGHRVPAYTASIDAALTLVPKGWQAITYTENNTAELYDASLKKRRGIQHRASARLPAIAICIAALKARAAISDC